MRSQRRIDASLTMARKNYGGNYGDTSLNPQTHPASHGAKPLSYTPPAMLALHSPRLLEPSNIPTQSPATASYLNFTSDARTL
jgi:hypothetical protein